jgi:hypothetical protein
MGEMDVKPQVRDRRKAGNGFPAAVREVNTALVGVLGIGPTGARSRSQSSQSEVTEGLGLRHWESL